MVSLLLVVIYLAFISLGLPDSLLGSAWPVIYKQINVPLSYSGIIFFIISIGTVISSLQSDRLTKLLSSAKVTVISIFLTAIALFGFSISSSFISLCLWAIPYGLGAGSIDAALNNYVALHYESKHMSWLHCFWGIGASIGPYIMSYGLLSNNNWTTGYRIIGFIQLTIAAITFISLPLWKRGNITTQQDGTSKPMSLKEIINLTGAKEVMLTFFCYCSLEQTVGLWASSYLVLAKQINEVTASTFASLFYVGITLGRAINGFLTLKYTDRQLVNLGHTIILFGIILVFIPFFKITSLIGLVIIGLGCAPVYPCIIHSTPEFFGEENSQAMVGIQMASAYIGICIAPPLFGFISNALSISLLPIYLLIILVTEYLMYKKLCNLK